MKTIQRVYLYAVSFVSLEVIAWAVIGLGRTLFSNDLVVGEVNLLAGSLSFLLVGLPVFLLHWWLAQRAAANDEEDRFSGVRALFLYAASLALWIPAAQNVLAILERALALAFQLDLWNITIGEGQTWADNLVGVAVNVLLAVYIHSVIRKDWAAGPRTEALPVMRRVWRYLFMLYGLVYAFAGVQQILTYIFSLADAVGDTGTYLMVNGIAFSIVGAALWAYFWQMIQTRLSEPGEQDSLLRLIALYLITFVAVVIALSATGVLLQEILEVLLSGLDGLDTLFGAVGEPVAMAVPGAVVWWYYSRILRQDVAALPNEPQRAALRRLYAYVLSLLGLGSAFGGLVMLVSLLIDLLIADMVWGLRLHSQIAGALAALLVGLPVWLRNWMPMNTQAAAEDEAGDHARRSVIRKGYLYLVLFVGVLGVMFTAGTMFFMVISELLGEHTPDFGIEVTRSMAFLVLFAILSLYHWRALQQDGRRATRLLSEQHTVFSVVVFEPGEGQFAEQMVEALKAEVPDMPVAVYQLGDELDESLMQAGAVVLPAELAANPPEVIRIWLDQFQGERVVVPLWAEGWLWAGMEEHRPAALAKRSAQMVGLLAEGQPAYYRSRSAWTVLGYAFAVFAGIAAVCILSSILIEVFQNF